MRVKNSGNAVRLPIFLAIALAAGIGIGATFFGKRTLTTDIISSSSKFKEILSHIERSYVDEVDTDSLADYGIYKMLEKLDPHTAYLPPQEAEYAMSELQNGFDGIGVEFNVFNDTVFVVSPLSGGPSEAVGIQSGDAIVEANGVSLTGSKLTNSLVLSTLRGKRGSEVKMKIKRKGYKNLMGFTVKRDKIPTFSIDAAYLMEDKKTAFIKVSRFSATTYDEFLVHLQRLQKEGMKQLILDLRNNPGGYLDRATEMVDEILAGREVIVYTDGKDDSNDKKIFAGRKGIFEKEPIVVLVDEGSASASEIVSGALQDNDRALIVGRRTFGKGLVQAPISLSDGSELRLTISRYYIPSGRSIQKPYEMGHLDEYMNELGERGKNGEYYAKDSIKNNEAKKYTTKKGRIVYGGGGITPDVFIPRDSSFFTSYLVELYGANLLREYALLYSNKNKEKLEKMGFANFLQRFDVGDDMLKEFLKMAEASNIVFKQADWNKSKAFVQEQIKALVARQSFRESSKMGLNNELFMVLNQNDDAVKTALKNMPKARELLQM